jgi:HEAT repeat protein
MQNETSQKYKAFHQYVFGSYRYYDTDGIPESVCIALEGPERSKAETLVLQALRKVFLDVRAVRAAGYLKLTEAIPLLEKRLAVWGFIMHKELRSSIVWALLKIKNDRQQLAKLIEVVNNRARINGLKQTDAVELLSDFGQEPLVVEALFHAFLGDDRWVSASAQHALMKIFIDNQKISELFKLHGFVPQFNIRDSIVKHIKLEIRK